MSISSQSAQPALLANPFEEPTFTSFADERRHLQVRLAAGFRLFARERYDEGAAGHISARDPEFPDTFWVNRFGIHFSRIKTSDLIRVNHDGDVVEGAGVVNTAAFAIHSRVHAARPDVVAAAHSHSVYGKALSSLGVEVWPITQDACAFYQDHAVFHDYTGVVLDVAEGDRIAKTIGHRKAIILRNHGLLTVGASVDAAVFWFMAMDRSCQAQLLAMAAGDPIHIDPDQARKTADQVGTQHGGWISAQPLFDKVLDEEPDLLN